MPGSEIETIAEILESYRTGAATPAEIVARSYARIRAKNDPAIFISLVDEDQAITEASTLVSATCRGCGAAQLAGE